MTTMMTTTNHDGDRDEDLGAGVVLFGKAAFGLVEGDHLGGGVLAQFDALGDDHGLIGQLFGGGGGFGLDIFQAHFHLAQPDDLAGFQDGFAGELLSIDERAVGGIEVAQHDVGAAQQDFAVMAGDGGFRDLEGIVLHPADRGLFHCQLVSFSGQSFAENYKSWHTSAWGDYGLPRRQVKRICA